MSRRVSRRGKVSQKRLRDLQDSIRNEMLMRKIAPSALTSDVPYDQGFKMSSRGKKKTTPKGLEGLLQYGMKTKKGSKVKMMGGNHHLHQSGLIHSHNIPRPMPNKLPVSVKPSTTSFSTTSSQQVSVKRDSGNRKYQLIMIAILALLVVGMAVYIQVFPKVCDIEKCEKEKTLQENPLSRVASKLAFCKRVEKSQAIKKALSDTLSKMTF